MPQIETRPDNATVEIFDFDRDVNGNVTAHYLIQWKGGHLRSKRREQIGYGPHKASAALWALGQRFTRTVWEVDPATFSETQSGASVAFEVKRNHDREPVPVIFRAEKSGDFKGEVTAVFPTLPGTNDVWTCTTYAHNGQHGSGSKDWYQATRAATPSEYAALKRELESAPFNYNLQLRKVWLPAFDDERRAALA